MATSSTKKTGGVKRFRGSKWERSETLETSCLSKMIIMTAFFLGGGRTESKNQKKNGHTSSQRASAAHETRAPPRTACPHPSSTTSRVHSAPPAILRRLWHTLFRASASTCVPKQVQRNESALTKRAFMYSILNGAALTAV